MKAKIFLFVSFIFVIFSGLFISCKDDGDTTKPVIGLIEPAEGDTLQIGGEHGIHFEMDLSDDVMLGSYKVEIHNNFDGHDHTRAFTGEAVPFSFERSWDVSGKKNEHVHHHEISIPDTVAAGDYHFMVYCTDAAGNESHVARNVVLSHDAGEHDHDDDHDDDDHNHAD
jgi:hypothetical protein